MNQRKNALVANAHEKVLQELFHSHATAKCFTLRLQ
jgi:hypothetical protein